MSTEIIESESLQLDIPPDPTPDRNLFRTEDPVEVLAAASRVADALKAKIEQAGMIQRIGGREHVKVEGWQTLGAMLGVTAKVVWSRPVEDGWEARAEVITADGRVIGAGEAMCTTAERNWARRDTYALRSMAQTRACSRALRGVLAFVTTLAGLDAAPPEEIAASDTAPEPELPMWARQTTDVAAAAQALVTIFKAAAVPDPMVRMAEIGRAIRGRCDGQIPVCVAGALEDVAAVVEAEEDSP